MNKYFGISEAEPEVRIKERRLQINPVNVFSHGSKCVNIYPSGMKYYPLAQKREVEKTGKDTGKDSGKNRDSYDEER